MSEYVFDPDKPVTISANGFHDHDSFEIEVEGCTACGLDFEAGEVFHNYMDYGRGEQALCEVCYVTYSPHKSENQNANIRTRLILREIRKNET